jgi:hypothetical protein
LLPAAFAVANVSSSEVEEGQMFAVPVSITTSCPVGFVEVTAVAVNVRHVPDAASVIAEALERALDVVAEDIPESGMVFKITDGLIFNDVDESDVHVIVCSDETPRSPATGAASVDTEIDVMLFVPATMVRAADAGTEDNTPRPKAATATSAMRLKVVFVDIFFLSISQS